MTRLLCLMLLAAPLAAADSDDLKAAVERLKAQPWRAEAAPQPETPPKAPKAAPKTSTAATPTAVPTAATPTAAPAAATAVETPTRVETPEWAKPALKAEGFGQLRLDAQPRLRAIYGRRLEIKATAQPLPWAKAVLGYDFLENKAKDFGLELSAWKSTLQLGQFRQKFGVEPQTGSGKLRFIERALIYGGTNPFGISALVKERVMGLHFLHKQDLGFLTYEAAGSLADNAKEDQAAGIAKPSAFPAQATDQDLSGVGHFSLASSWRAFKAKAGASFTRDSQNLSYEAQRTADQQYEELFGLDFGLDLGARVSLQAEWLASNLYKGQGSAPRDFWGGLLSRKEGHYASAAVKLPWDLECLGRWEALASGPQAVTAGLKWSWLSGGHSALNYTVFGYDGNFGALAGTEMLLLQQQFGF